MSPVLSARLKLPAATSHVFLGFSFASNAFLMLAHGKHAALDAAVHQYLGAVMAVVALLVLCEGVWRHGFLLSWAKSAALMVEVSVTSSSSSSSSSSCMSSPQQQHCQ
jgi:hypothetical protein